MSGPLPKFPCPPILDLEEALAAADAGDTWTTDEHGNAVRDEPRSEEELMKPWEERAAEVRAKLGLVYEG